MASFTGVGDNTELQMAAKGDEVFVSISGTYDMTIAFQREKGAPGSGAWEDIKRYTTEDATVAEVYTTIQANEKVRLIVLVDTSGTATATLTDYLVKPHPTTTVRDEEGNTLLSYDQRGATFPQNLKVEGDLRLEKSVLFEDFHGTWAIGDAGPADRFSSTAGGGTGNEAATTVANSLCGEVTLTSASDDGAHAANCSTLTAINLGWKANQGGLALRARIKIDDVSEAVLFVGFTDTVSTTVELPIYMNAAAIDSDAVNACGVIYDVDATTDKFYVGGVKANTDTDPIALNAVTPVDATYFVIEMEIDTAGTIKAWVDDQFLGEVPNAVTVTAALTPAIIVGNRSANQVVATIDYIEVSQNR